MRYQISAHARKRMRERGISTRFLEAALRHPTKVVYDEQGRLLLKKVYQKEGRKRLLLIAGEMREGLFRLITVIDTSKVRKYLT